MRIAVPPAVSRNATKPANSEPSGAFPDNSENTRVTLTAMLMNSHKAPAEAARQEAAELVRSAAEPRAPGEQIQRSIARAATRLGWPYRRTEDIWRREARRIDSWEMDQLRAFQPRNGKRNSKRERSPAIHRD